MDNATVPKVADQWESPERNKIENDKIHKIRRKADFVLILTFLLIM
jgi:hypothetical protein